VTAPAAPQGPFVDLHSHTTASDGRATPEELIALAKAADLQAVGITDHDTLQGLPAAQRAADAIGIELVHGIELSTIDGTREIHLLGLHLVATDALADRLIAVQSARVDRAVEMVAKLNKLGMPVTMEMVHEQAAGGAVGRPHVARALVSGGFTNDEPLRLVKALQDDAQQVWRLNGGVIRGNTFEVDVELHTRSTAPTGAR